MPARRFFRHGLGDVPVFEDFPVFVQTEDVDDRFAAFVRRELAVDVDDDEVVFGNDALDVRVRLRVFFEERREGVDECLAAVKTFAASLAFISLLAILPAIFFDLL